MFLKVPQVLPHSAQGMPLTVLCGVRPNALTHLQDCDHTSRVRVVGPVEPGGDGGVGVFLGCGCIVHPVHNPLETLRLHDAVKRGPA